MSDQKNNNTEPVMNPKDSTQKIDQKDKSVKGLYHPDELDEAYDEFDDMFKIVKNVFNKEHCTIL